MTPTRVTLPDVTLSVLDEGSGPAVLLLHGWPDRALMWEHQIRALAAAGYRVIAPDLRGFGDSDRPEGVEQYTLRRTAGDVLALADALGVEEFALAGHDWGASLGWAVATFSERVSRYAAFSVGHPGAFRSAGLEQKSLSWYMLWFQFPGVAESVLPADDWALLRSWAHPGAAPDDPAAARQVADLSRPGALTASLNWYRANIDPATFVGVEPPPLPRISRPVFGVWSSADMALTEEQMTRSAEFVDGPFTYRRVDDVGHWIPVEAPERTAELLTEFLAAPGR
ncbi:alpha/beta fold hydrolase [Pseudonocardia sp. KRD-291]|nr:alpha/beta fold hydrolase [Pseudonocardia sp. KRD291]